VVTVVVGATNDEEEIAMTAPTRANPAGVRSFDHRRLASLPEYHDAARSLNRLVEAIATAEGLALGQKDWLAAVRDLAASLPFADGCDRCLHDDDAEWVVAPDSLAVEAERDWLDAHYRCPGCGVAWSCGWALWAPALL
jgi:hypothetical protein